MRKAYIQLRHALVPVALLSLLALFVSACGAPTEVPKPQAVPPTAAITRDTPVPAALATTEAPATAPSLSQDAPPAGEGAGMAAPGADVASWKVNRHTAGGVTYSYRYPPGWTPDLAYCAPGGARSASSSQLPARCAATDILVGQKARDVGTIRGENITLGGKQAIKEIDRAPRNGQAELIYTVMIYDPTGTPLVGFSTNIGPGTDAATINNIISMLDQVAGTLVVGR